MTFHIFVVGGDQGCARGVQSRAPGQYQDVHVRDRGISNSSRGDAEMKAFRAFVSETETRNWCMALIGISFTLKQ